MLASSLARGKILEVSNWVDSASVELSKVEEKEEIPWCCLDAKEYKSLVAPCKIFEICLCYEISPSSLLHVESKKSKESSDSCSILVAHGFAKKQIRSLSILLRNFYPTPIRSLASCQSEKKCCVDSKNSKRACSKA